MQATDSSTIDATTFAGAVSISAGSSTSVGISIALSLAENTITSALEAAIISTDVVGATSVHVTAEDSAGITTTVSAAAVSVAVGSNGVAVGGGGAVALNEILGTNNAFVQSSTLDTSSSPVGAVTIEASSTGAIQAFVLAVSVSVAVGDEAGVGVAIGISVARNLIGWSPTGLATTTYTSDGLPSSVDVGDTVTVDGGALDGQTFQYVGPGITGTVIYLNRQDFSDTSLWMNLGTQSKATYNTSSETTSLANGNTVTVEGGQFAGDTFEYIGPGIAGEVDLSVQSYDDPTAWEQVGMTESDSEVQAYSSDSSIDSSGALMVTASESSTINAIVAAGAVAIAGGGDAGVGVSAGGVFTQNKIADDVRAYVDGDAGNGISADQRDDHRHRRRGDPRDRGRRQRRSRDRRRRRGSRSRSGSRSHSTDVSGAVAAFIENATHGVLDDLGRHRHRRDRERPPGDRHRHLGPARPGHALDHRR